MSRKFQHRKDRNHETIVDGLASAGWGFLDTSQTGLGIDGFAVKAGRIIPLEIKDGALPPSKRTLTPKEVKRHAWFRSFGVEVLLMRSPEDLAQLDREARTRYEISATTREEVDGLGKVNQPKGAQPRVSVFCSCGCQWHGWDAVNNPIIDSHAWRCGAPISRNQFEGAGHRARIPTHWLLEKEQMA